MIDVCLTFACHVTDIDGVGRRYTIKEHVFSCVSGVRTMRAMPYQDSIA